MRNLLVAILYVFPLTVYAQEAVRPRAVGVQSTQLQDVGPWGAAALPEGLLPLPSDLWRNSDPATLGLLLTKITPDQRFPSLNNLVRRAIFSGGTAPTNDPDIAYARFGAANRFGPAQATARLVFGVPRLASEPSLATIAIDAGLRVGRIEEACGLIEAVSAPAQGTIWLESRAACYALNDEAAAANLSVDLAKSRGLTDTWLSRAIAAVAGPLTAPPPFRVDSGRAIALSLRGKLKPPLTLAASQDPMALSALAGSAEFLTTLEPQERLALVRNGANRGVVPLSVVASHQPADDPIPDPIPDPAPDPAPDLAIALPPLPERITKKILAAPSLALRSLEGRLAYEDIKTIMATQPGLMTLADVPILAEAALWSGDGALASSIASLSPDPLDSRLVLIMALYDTTRQPLSVETRMNAAGVDPVARRVAVRDAGVAWVAGVPVGGGLSLLVEAGFPSGPAGQVGLRTALNLAGGRGAKGEVVLLTALALQGVEPTSIDAETLMSAVGALRRVGLPDAAKDLARDYLLAHFVTLPSRQSLRPRATAAPNISSARPPAVSPVAPPPVAAPRPAARAPARVAPTPSLPLAPAPRLRTKPSWGTP